MQRKENTVRNLQRGCVMLAEQVVLISSSTLSVCPKVRTNESKSDVIVAGNIFIQDQH